MNASIRILLGLPLLGLTVACGGKDDGSEESTGTDVIEGEKRPTLTQTPTQTPMPIPTQTPMPIPTQTSLRSPSTPR